MLLNPFNKAVTVLDGRVTVHDEDAIASPAMDKLVYTAVFGEPDDREDARWLIWEIGQAVGVQPSSIHDLYLARGRGLTGGFTVPAMNIRGMAYDTGRALFRSAVRLKVGALIQEIARSEIAYTDQRPAEYVAVMLAAALREGFRGPIFIQGDHFQVSAKKFAVDPVTEVNGVKQLAREAIAAGFYNIDVDTSTLVDLSKPTLREQQRTNYEQAVELALTVRGLEPEGVTISIGGEIGEVGTQNSTVEEQETYMDGFNETLGRRAPGTEGLSKISVQSGTTHGGVVLADGSIADVKIDFDTLARLSKMAREKYGLTGAVQHGASTQFFYKTRKKALGPFKKRFWDLPAEVKTRLAKAYEEKFSFLFTQLAVVNTRNVVDRFVKPVEQHKPQPHPDLAVVEAAPDDADLSD